MSRWLLLLALATPVYAFRVNVPPLPNPKDWGPAMVAWWPLDEASGTRRNGNDTSIGSCGAACDLTPLNTPGNDATHFQEGTAALAVVAASDQGLRCTYAGGCAPLNIGSGSITWGAWLRPSATIVATPPAFWLESASKSLDTTQPLLGGGYSSFLSSASGKYRCTVTNQNIGTTTADAATAPAANVYRHLVCQWDDPSLTLAAYSNGAVDGTFSPTVAPGYVPTIGERAFTLGGPTTGIAWDGEIDEAFVYAGSMAAASICRICAVGIQGTLGACDPTTPANYQSCSADADCQDTTVGHLATATCDTTSGLCQGRRHSACGDCTITSICNQATP